MTESPIRKIRSSFSLTQVKFAKQAGVSQGYVSALESGDTQIVETLYRFLDAVGIDMPSLEKRHEEFVELRRREIKERLGLEKYR